MPMQDRHIPLVHQDTLEGILTWYARVRYGKVWTYAGEKFTQESQRVTEKGREARRSYIDDVQRLRSKKEWAESDKCQQSTQIWANKRERAAGVEKLYIHSKNTRNPRIVTREKRLEEVGNDRLRTYETPRLNRGSKTVVTLERSSLQRWQKRSTVDT